jgi:2-iminobutanoate/2-iminopropanoate deaminase
LLRENAMNKKHNPTTIAAPVGAYTHGIEVPAGARWLAVSGQIGTAPDGIVPADVGAQAENAFRNIKAILEEAGMGIGDVVKLTTYLTRAESIPAYRAARERVMGDARPASTLVVISALVKPELLVEIEAWAARA